jgi:transglycosylase-like protein with SLT domain
VKLLHSIAMATCLLVTGTTAGQASAGVPPDVVCDGLDHGTALSYPAMKTLVKANSKTTKFTTELILALAWMESKFHPLNCTSPPNTARGVLSISKGAFTDVQNASSDFDNTTFDDLFQAGINVQVASKYLDMRQVKTNDDGTTVSLSTADTIRRYGTHTDAYVNKVIAGEACLLSLGDADDPMPCLKAIRP